MESVCAVCVVPSKAAYKLSFFKNAQQDVHGCMQMEDYLFLLLAELGPSYAERRP